MNTALNNKIGLLPVDQGSDLGIYDILKPIVNVDNEHYFKYRGYISMQVVFRLIWNSMRFERSFGWIIIRGFLLL